MDDTVSVLLFMQSEVIQDHTSDYQVTLQSFIESHTHSKLLLCLGIIDHLK